MLHSLERAPTDRPLVIQYHRLSSEEQANGHGLDRQRTGGDAWCMRNGLTVDVRLEDIGYSAFTGDHIRRGHMGRVLTAIDAGTIIAGSVLVIENLDRLSRQDAFEAIRVFTNIVTRGVAIVTVCDGYRYTRDGSAMDRMMAFVLSVMHFGRGNSESETKSSRVGQAWEEKRKRAREDKAPHGARCPAWIRLTTDGYEPIPERQAEVRRMFERTIAGWGRRKIVKDLVARDVLPWISPSTKRPVPAWHDSYVQKILTGCEAYGTYRPSRAPKGGRKVYEEVVEGYYPAAVDRATFERARAAAVVRKGSGGRKGAFGNLLQGLCRCGACGKGMTIENKGPRSRGPKLVCQRAVLDDCSHDFRYDYFLAEISVIFGIGEHADNLVRESQERGAALRDRAILKEAERHDVAERIKRLVKRMEVNDDEALDEALRELRASARRLSTELDELAAQATRAAELAGPRSPQGLLAFYERLRSLPATEAPNARNEVNQRLRSIVTKIVFLEGQLEVYFVEGGRSWADIGAGLPALPNPGHFAGIDQSGRQTRRGRSADDPPPDGSP